LEAAHDKQLMFVFFLPGKVIADGHDSHIIIVDVFAGG
jgi:hypothetical protein